MLAATLRRVLSLHRVVLGAVTQLRPSTSQCGGTEGGSLGSSPSITRTHRILSETVPAKPGRKAFRSIVRANGEAAVAAKGVSGEQEKRLVNALLEARARSGADTSGQILFYERPVDKQPRVEAQRVFNAYRSSFDKMLLDCLADDLKNDSTRLPIACNFGATGSGKTIQLRQLCDNFHRVGGVSVYITFNGDERANQYLDAHDLVKLRIIRRVLHVLAGRAMDLQEVIDQFDGYIRDLKLDEGDNLVRVIRATAGADPTAPVLLAVDELRLLCETGEPPVGQQSAEAVRGLSALGALSQHTAISVKRRTPECLRGVLYVAASSYGAIDVQKCMTGSARKVFMLPLPPLNLAPFEALALANIPRGEQGSQRYARARHILWVNQSRARWLASTAKDLRGLHYKSFTDTWHKGQIEFFRSRRVGLGIDAIHAAKKAEEFFRTQLLMSLFTAADASDEVPFNLSLGPALLGDAAGLCSIIRCRDDNGAGYINEYDTVYMNPIAAQRCAEIILADQSSALATETLELTKLLQRIPEGPKARDTGKLYEQVITRGFVCRALALAEQTKVIGRTVSVATLLLGSEGVGSPVGQVMVDLAGLDRIPEIAVERFPRAYDGKKYNANAVGDITHAPVPCWAVFRDRFTISSSTRCYSFLVHMAKSQCASRSKPRSGRTARDSQHLNGSAKTFNYMCLGPSTIQLNSSSRRSRWWLSLSHPTRTMLWRVCTKSVFSANQSSLLT